MPKRRANGEGNIRKRKDGRWEGRYTAGYDANGKAITKNVLGRTQAEVKDKLEEAKEMVSHKVAEVSQMAHSMAQFLTDAEVEQLLGEFSMDTCWDQAVEAENLAQAKAYSTRLSDLAGQLEAASAQLVDLDKGQATAFDFS